MRTAPALQKGGQVRRGVLGAGRGLARSCRLETFSPPPLWGGFSEETAERKPRAGGVSLLSASSKGAPMSLVFLNSNELMPLSRSIWNRMSSKSTPT